MSMNVFLQVTACSNASTRWEATTVHVTSILKEICLTGESVRVSVICDAVHRTIFPHFNSRLPLSYSFNPLSTDDMR